jgi:uncharacterized repeat protein (TIGR01451 family)
VGVFMAERGPRPFVLLALAVGLAGCRGVGGDPAAPPGAHAPGSPSPPAATAADHPKPSFLASLTPPDPAAARLEVKPQTEPSCRVGKEWVVVASVVDADGRPLPRRRIEWALDGAGAIVAVDERGFLPGRGRKVDDHTAYSYTDHFEHRIEGDGDSGGVTVGPGQSWCVVRSAAEGELRLTVSAPEVGDGAKNRVVVTQHWIDAGLAPPPATAARTGTEQALTARVFRSSDNRPKAGTAVRYRLLDGPPALFLPGQTQEVVVPSGADGTAPARLVQAAARPGRNRIAVEVLGADAAVVGQSETAVDWKPPDVSVAVSLPASVPADREAPCTVTVRNDSAAEARTVTVRIAVPDGWRLLRTDPTPFPEGNVLVWTLAALPAHGERSFQLAFQPGRVGPTAGRASVAAGDGRRDEKEILCQVVPPQVARLKVEPDGPAAGVVGGPLSYRVTVSNTGTGPATNVRLRAALDGLEADGGADAAVGPLGPGESRTVTLAVRPTRAGDAAARLTATADGGARDEARRAVTVRDARLALRLSGPAVCLAGGRAEWDLEVRNAGDTPLDGAVVSDALPPELELVEATDGGRPQGREVVWQVGPLPVGGEKRLRLTTTAARPAERAVNAAAAVASAAADGGAAAEVRAQAQQAVAVRGVAAFKLAVSGRDGVVEVGGRTVYTITVTNRGSLPGERVQITATLPSELRVVAVGGPAPYRVEGGRLTFAPVQELPPGQALTFTVEAEAVQPGEVRVRVAMTAAALREPVFKEESTNVR